jgi:radical SAM superfamily enzyme YgiQ (UPF0313 family)
MNKTILFINPWIHDFAAYDFWSKPLGFLCLASLLRENVYNIQFIDCLNPYHPDLKKDSTLEQPRRKPAGNGKYPKEEIARPEPLKNFSRRYSRYGVTPRIFKNELARVKKPDLIFVTSMMTYWYPGVFETIDITRQSIPDVPIILGGNYATLCTEHAKKHSGADLVVPGHGEKHIANILKDFLADDPQILPDFNDLDSYPYPAYDLLLHIDQVSLITSRGCPFKCSYCASPLLNGGFRTRNPIKVVDEIEFWSGRYGVKNFSFYDDALLVNAQERSIPMMKEIIKRGLACSFHCPNGLHLREITDEVALLMHRSGFRTIRFGFETAQEERQRQSGGKITNEETREAISSLKRAGYKTDEIGMYILCGLPDQTAEEVRNSITFIKSIGARPVLAEFSPIPGIHCFPAGMTTLRILCTGN